MLSTFNDDWMKDNSISQFDVHSAMNEIAHRNRHEDSRLARNNARIIDAELKLLANVAHGFESARPLQEIEFP